MTDYSDASNIAYISDHQNFPIEDERPVRVEPGAYEVVMHHYWKGYLYGKSAKLILVFRITTPGPYYGAHLYRCYNIKGLTKRKEIIPKGWHSTFVREYSALFGAPAKLRDIGIRKYRNKVFLASVRTVTKDARQRPLPKSLQYSVVDELTKIVVG